MLLHLRVPSFFFLFILSPLDRVNWVLFLDHPVENKIVLVAHSVEEVLEELSKVSDVRLFFELEASAIV